MRKSLDEIMTEHGSDKASWAHDYCKHYETWFGPLRDEPVVLLELGVGGEDKELGGASLLGWNEYFEKACCITGVDIYDKSELAKQGIRIYQGSQDDEEFLMGIINDIEVGNPNIIIDDASHINKLTIKSFQLLFHHLEKGGLYIIEDLTCAYRWDFGGSTALNNMELPTIMNYLFTMLHDLNPVRIGNQDYKDIPDFVGVESVHFYPDMVVIKKAL